ncbi:MAG: YhdH/YhfP family quinone oxidoreductase [Desulfobacterales bacterium]|nr:YhdH/YhfP family quinone oxidoreductase [Desulfobacterales bacterium]
MIVESPDKETCQRSIQDKSIDDLPAGDVLIRVKYSSLNYKDALSATGNRGVTQNYPHTPGVDAAGTVSESLQDTFNVGDKVLVTGYDLGMNTSGGFGQYVRVPAQWVVRLPKNLTLKESMFYGTAGFTAGLSVYEIVRGVDKEKGDILVTGASGGVGSISVAILAKLGYSVIAVSGKPEGREFLTGLGAKEVIDREAATDGSSRPMLKARWAGVIDTVGGDILATAIKSVHPWGIVTCCGNVASPDLPINVFPFILRGARLIGINSQTCPMDHRLKVWEKLAGDWKVNQEKEFYKEITLEHLEENIELILKGGQKGRVLVNLEN